jgi:hypothetical protein
MIAVMTSYKKSFNEDQQTKEEAATTSWTEN